MWGVAVRNSVQMAIDEANEAGGVNGRTIRLVAKDDRYDPQMAANEVRELVAQERVFAILSPLGTPTAHAAANHATDKEVLYLFPVATIDDVMPNEQEYLFTTMPPEREAVAFGLSRLLESGTAKNVAVIAPDDALGYAVRDGVIAELARSGLTLTAYVGVAPDATDLSAPLSWLRKANIDIVVLGLVGDQALAVARAAQRLNWRPSVLCSSACHTAEFAALGGTMVEGLYAVGQVPVPYPDERAIRTWSQRYTTKFGTLPTQQSIAGYRNGKLFLAVLEKTGRTPTQENFIRALKNLGPWTDPQVGGPELSFSDEDHLGTHTGFLAQVKQGRWVLARDSTTKP